MVLMAQDLLKAGEGTVIQVFKYLKVYKIYNFECSVKKFTLETKREILDNHISVEVNEKIRGESWSFNGQHHKFITWYMENLLWLTLNCQLFIDYWRRVLKKPFKSKSTLRLWPLDVCICIWSLLLKLIIEIDVES